jgi:hypothetical protein
MKSSQNGMDFLCIGHLGKMPDRVDNPGMGTTAQNHQPLVFNTKSDGDTDRDEIPAPLNLDDLPGEVRDQLIEQLERMHLKWADESVPALDHQTPRQAVKSAEGRIKVIDLINDWENQTAHMEAPQFRFDFNRLRDDLGLPRE